MCQRYHTMLYEDVSQHSAWFGHAHSLCRHDSTPLPKTILLVVILGSMGESILHDAMYPIKTLPLYTQVEKDILYLGDYWSDYRRLYVD